MSFARPATAANSGRNFSWPGSQSRFSSFRCFSMKVCPEDISFGSLMECEEGAGIPYFPMYV